MTAQQFLVVLRARSALLSIVFALVVSAAIVGSLLWPKSYLGEVSLVVDSVSPEPVSGQQPSAEALPTDIATQLEEIASHSVALRVVDKLNLTANPDFESAYLRATKGRGSIRDWVADRLLFKNLDAHTSSNRANKQSNVIIIDAYAQDPELAANMANAFAEGYIQTHLELKVEPARRQSAWFDDQLKRLSATLEAAQQRLSDYQRENNVVGTDSRVDIANARLTEISDQLIAAQTAMYDAKTRLKQMNEALRLGKLQELPDLSGNLLLQTEKANLAVAEGKLAQISSNFGANHPDYISAKAQVTELTRKLLAEVDIAKGSIEQSAAIAERQEAELSGALNKQRDVVLALKRQQDRQEALKAQVDDAQRAYDAGAERATQIKLQSRLDQSSIAILSPAIQPIFPAYPKLLLNVALSIVLGVMLATALALLQELRDPRVRSAADICDLSGIALLAEIPQVVGRGKMHQYFRRPRRALHFIPSTRFK